MNIHEIASKVSRGDIQEASVSVARKKYERSLSQVMKGLRQAIQSISVIIDNYESPSDGNQKKIRFLKNRRSTLVEIEDTLSDF